jgi:hypothetical protein
VPRAAQNKLYQSFVKGLITEASPLTYPENASTDELNTVIKFKGSRSRRLGLDYEPSSVSATLTDLADNEFITEFAWKNVANDANTNFLVIQVKRTLHFFDMDAIPITSSPKSFTIDLTTYAAPFADPSQIDTTPVQMTSGKGYLFVVSPFIEPILVDYDLEFGTIDVLKIIIKVRDFDGVDDGLSNEDQPTTLSNEHYYNLRNQGWVQPGPNGVVDGTPTTPFSGSAPSGSSSGIGGGGMYIDRSGDFGHTEEP